MIGPEYTRRTLASMRRRTAGRSKVLTTRVRSAGATASLERRDAHAVAAAISAATRVSYARRRAGRWVSDRPARATAPPTAVSRRLTIRP